MSSGLQLASTATIIAPSYRSIPAWLAPLPSPLQYTSAKRIGSPSGVYRRKLSFNEPRSSSIRATGRASSSTTTRPKQSDAGPGACCNDRSPDSAQGVSDRLRPARRGAHPRGKCEEPETQPDGQSDADGEGEHHADA